MSQILLLLVLIVLSTPSGETRNSIMVELPAMYVVIEVGEVHSNDKTGELRVVRGLTNKKVFSTDPKTKKMYIDSVYKFARDYTFYRKKEEI